MSEENSELKSASEKKRPKDYLFQAIILWSQSHGTAPLPSTSTTRQQPPCPPSATRPSWWVDCTSSPASPPPSPGQTPSVSVAGSENLPLSLTGLADLLLHPSSINLNPPRSGRRRLPRPGSPDLNLLSVVDQGSDTSQRLRKGSCPSRCPRAGS